MELIQKRSDKGEIPTTFCQHCRETNQVAFVKIQNDREVIKCKGCHEVVIERPIK